MPKRVRASRAPNCTHIEMDRVYGRDQQCGNCGRFPSIGFLYECKQDCETEALCDLLSAENEDPIEPAKSKVRLGLERAGLSESVILTAEKGHYTEAQPNCQPLRRRLPTTMVLSTASWRETRYMTYACLSGPC
jgi:hypothetical protein